MTNAEILAQAVSPLEPLGYEALAEAIEHMHALGHEAVTAEERALVAAAKRVVKWRAKRPAIAV